MNSDKKENPLLSLLFNILIPVIILDKFVSTLAKYDIQTTPTVALIVALSFPILYGLADYLKTKKTNWISVFGIVNILMSGGFALLKVEGIWFAIKEAAFPLIIGIAVLISAFTSKPLISLFINGAPIFDKEKIKLKTDELGTQLNYMQLLKNANLLFAVSFFISSILNYVLAINIFTDIDPSLTNTEKETILNNQLSKMTWMGYVVIALPMVFFMLFVMWYFVTGLKKITGLSLESLMLPPPEKK